MNIFSILKHVVIGLSILCLAYSLPTLTNTSPRPTTTSTTSLTTTSTPSTPSLTTTSTPSTLSLSTTSRYLEPNPCGGINPAPGHVTDDEVQESVNEVKPITSKIVNTLSSFKQIMERKWMVNTGLRAVLERRSQGDYTSDIFPYFTINETLERHGLFGEIYRNGSIIEIYHTQMKEIEKMKDNDAEFIQYSTDIITDVQLLRCHLQILSRFINEFTPSVEFSVPENKIDDDNDSHRYIKYFQIIYMTKNYFEGLTNYLRGN